MPVSRERANEMAREILAERQTEEQLQRKHEALLEAFKRLEEPLSPRLSSTPRSTTLGAPASGASPES